jgi:hypothetical protein
VVPPDIDLSGGIVRLGAPALVLCFALTGCGGGEEESTSGESSESSETLEATEGSSGPDYEAYDDAELCTGPFETWMERDAAATDELRQAAATGSVDEATIDQILEPSDMAVAALATADDKELSSLATSYPELTREFALASAGEDSAAQVDALGNVTDAKAAIIDRCLALSTQ